MLGALKILWNRLPIKKIKTGFKGVEIGNIKGEGLTSEKRKMTGGVGLYISKLFGGKKKKNGSGIHFFTTQKNRFKTQRTKDRRQITVQ